MQSAHRIGLLCLATSFGVAPSSATSQTLAPACDAELSESTYTHGDAVVFSSLRFSNLGAIPVPVRLRVEIAHAGNTVQFLEQLEAVGLDNVWNVGDLRVDPGNTFDPDASSAEAGGPSGWGLESLKIDIGPTTSQTRTVHRFLPPLAVAHHHFEFVVTRDGSGPGDAATMSVLKNEHIAPSNISPFAVYLRNVDGTLDLYIGINPGPTMRWFELRDSLELNLRYAVDVYWDSERDFWQAWVDGQPAGSGVVEDTDPQVVNYFVLGSSISGPTRNSTYFLDNYYVGGRIGSLTWQLLDFGEDGNLVLPVGAEFDIAPWAPLTIESGLPTGDWAVRCAIEQPGTGVLLAEDVVVFEIR